MSKYEIRREGKVFARWDLESMTPDRGTLSSMKAAGYRLYINGRLQR